MVRLGASKAASGGSGGSCGRGPLQEKSKPTEGLLVEGEKARNETIFDWHELKGFQSGALLLKPSGCL